VDQLVPLFLLDVAADVPGLSGLFVAGILSAALRLEHIVELHGIYI
jgi:hypothetical protein